MKELYKQGWYSSSGNSEDFWDDGLGWYLGMFLAFLIFASPALLFFID